MNLIQSINEATKGGDREYQTYASWKAACKKKAGEGKIEWIGDKDIGECHVDGKSIGEWDGEKGLVYESADYAKQLVRGEKAGPGLLNKLDHWFTNMMIVKDANRFLPAESAIKQLKKAGFSDEQIALIRDAATDAANTAVETMHKKHGEEAVPRKYISALPSSFGVFDLFLNVSEDIHKEFAALMRKLFDKKIDKIADKLVIVKEGYWGSDDWGSMSKRDFKRRELEHELRHEDEAERRRRGAAAAEAGRGQSARDFGNRTMSYAKPKAELGTFEIEIDGKVWKREGQPVRFTNKAHADKAAETMRGKDWNKNKKVEVKKLDEAYYITEDEELQALGRELKNPSKAVPKSEKPADDTAEAPAKVELAKTVKAKSIEDELKVGDKVVPKLGPHKGTEHEITEVRPNGYIIKPIGIADTEVKYTKGKGAQQAHSALAKAEQLEKVKTNESLFALVALGSAIVEGDVKSTKSIGKEVHPMDKPGMRRRYEEYVKARDKAGKPHMSYGSWALYTDMEDKKAEVKKEGIEEGWKSGAAAVALTGAVVAGIASSPKVEINGETYDKAISSAPANAKSAVVKINGKDTKVLYWNAVGNKGHTTKAYKIAEAASPREDIPPYAVCYTSDGVVRKDDVYMGDKADCIEYIRKHKAPKGMNFDIMHIDSGRLVSYVL